MKEFLFVIKDNTTETTKLVKVTEADENAAKEKFAKAFAPFLDFSYNDIFKMADYNDVEITYTEYTNIINV